MRSISFKTIATLILFGLLACKSNTTTSDKKATTETNVVTLTEAQLKNAQLTISTIQTRNMHSTIKVNGMVDVPPQSLVSVSFPLGGYLKSSHLLPGTSVHKGEVLAIMEDQSYVQLQQDYLMAKAKMDYLSVDVQRQKELSDADAASKKNYQQVLSEFKMQQIIIKALEEKLQIIGIQPNKLQVSNISRTVAVRSPINGYVAKVNVNIGKFVNPSDVLFELVNPDDIHAAMTVFEKDIAHLQKGMMGKVALADQPNKQFDVEIILVTKNISDNRTGLVHCHFENQNHDLLPGMFLTGSFNLNNKQAPALPEAAVVRYEGKHYVFIANNNRSFQLTEVYIGNSLEGYVEILTDLSGKSIVTQNAYTLLGKLKNTAEEE